MQDNGIYCQDLETLRLLIFFDATLDPYVNCTVLDCEYANHSKKPLS